MPPTRRGFTLLVSGALSLLLSVAPALAQPVPDRLWIGPMPFTAGRTMRPDFFPMLSDPANWPTVLGSMQIFKSYLIDFGYEGVQYDGLREGKLDYGRVLGVERHVQSRGVKAGVIVNAFHDQSVKAPQPQQASREACERTRQFLAGYLAAGGKADHIVLQTWQPYPDRTGPETDPLTVVGLQRTLLQEAKLIR